MNSCPFVPPKQAPLWGMLPFKAGKNSRYHLHAQSVLLTNQKESQVLPWQLTRHAYWCWHGNHSCHHPGRRRLQAEISAAAQTRKRLPLFQFAADRHSGRRAAVESRKTTRRLSLRAIRCFPRRDFHNGICLNSLGTSSVVHDKFAQTYWLHLEKMLNLMK